MKEVALKTSGHKEFQNVRVTTKRAHLLSLPPLIQREGKLLTGLFKTILLDRQILAKWCLVQPSVSI